MINSKITSVVATIAFGMQATFGFAATQNLQKTGFEALIENGVEGNSEVVAEALSNAQANVGMGIKPDVAIKMMSSELIEKGVTFNDINTYVQENASVSDYASFRENLDNAFYGINPGQISDSEMAVVMKRAVSTTRTEGLAWNGCTSASFGLAIGIAAVIVGIVALAKTATSTTQKDNVNSTYDSKKTARTNQYNSEVGNIQGIEGVLGADIGKQTGLRDKAQSDINTYQAQMDAASASSNTAAYNTAKLAHDKAALDVTYYNGLIAADLSTLSNYANDPTLKATQIAALTAQYNSDLSGIDAAKAADLIGAIKQDTDSTRKSKHTAAVLGEIAGGAAVAGGLMIGFGMADCNN